MKRFLLLALVVSIMVTTGPVLADDGFYVIAGSGKAGMQINSVPYIISSPGLYCLAGNLNHTGTGNGITVNPNVSNVTIDLMGFSLTGTTVGTSTGILIQGGCSNVEIRNGSVNNFGSGGCINGDETSSGIRVIGVRASGSSTTAINLFGTNNLVMGCSFMDAGAGIFVGSGSMVKGNHVAGNSGTGISTSDGCTIAGNLCISNGTGMWTSHGCSVLDNTVWNNGDYGINAGSYCTITRNTARGNPTAGIYSGQYCTITNNTSQILTNGLNCTLANNTVYP